MKALTANRLDDGAVVYWTGSAWSRRLGDAAGLEGDAAEAALAAAIAADTLVVGPYLFPLAAPGRPDPRVKARETLRARGGPTAGATLRKV